MQHVIECELTHIGVDGYQQTIQFTAGIWRDLSEQQKAAYNGNPPSSSMGICCISLEIERHCSIISGIVLSDFHVNHVWQYTKQALNTVENAMEAYVVGVPAKSHILTLPLVYWRFSTYLLLRQGKEIR